MSNRKNHLPYRELGRLLEDWRSTRFRSALALFREARFSFSYYTYADWERGALLPGIDGILELARYFKVDERPAILRWAEVQMPSPRLKSLFRQGQPGLAAPEAPAGEAETAAPTFENTWVFGPREQEAIKRHPWFFDLCMRLAGAHPNALSYKELGMRKQAELDEFVRHRLQPWIAQGRMTYKDKRLSLAAPHFHLPKTGGWQETRQLNLKRAFERVTAKIDSKALAEGRASREVITRTLTGGQITAWSERLGALATEFLSLPYETGAEPALTYSFIALFGERVLTIKD